MLLKGRCIIIHPTVIKQSGTRLTISDEQYEQLVKKPQAVLWNRDGMYGLVPLARIKNAIQWEQDTLHTMYEGKLIERKISFTWGETLEIPPETGQTLERDG